MQGGKLAEPTNAQEHQALAGKKYDWLGLTKSGRYKEAKNISFYTNFFPL